MKTETLINSETVANPWQFESGYQDGSTVLLKFGTRYYNPALGKWTQLIYQPNHLHAYPILPYSRNEKGSRRV